MWRAITINRRLVCNDTTGPWVAHSHPRSDPLHIAPDVQNSTRFRGSVRTLVLVRCWLRSVEGAAFVGREGYMGIRSGTARRCDSEARPGVRCAPRCQQFCAAAGCRRAVGRLSVDTGEGARTAIDWVVHEGAGARSGWLGAGRPLCSDAVGANLRQGPRWGVGRPVIRVSDGAWLDDKPACGFGEGASGRGCGRLPATTGAELTFFWAALTTSTNALVHWVGESMASTCTGPSTSPPARARW